ncbi:ParB N-terminal domain-containing protein [Candidatus Sulfidibacterium hydrothermale]|uniref:ParB N-terminal domain-containing protein n=1 Tax=Candidatus Sulfidibacterium hydrothermale TaxID=2875962 RepID=UPI001F0AA808|nr:ParB N-terminal domain-containing protein [Candidatus Sulfidibacterium hydrothermale]UBM61329.1 ParB N-terminal domain-containing protein [Candidatus Sulfidibacterium hydrothermale]
MSHYRKLIDISLLNINIENPRFEMVGNQRDAIKTMIEDQKEKLIKLAEDILNQGLNPGDPIFITKHEKQEGEYNVIEGNRRVTVLKLLENPELISEKQKFFLNKFKKLSEQYSKAPIDKIPCILFDSEKEAEHWVELKHTGQNDGIGTVGWDAQQKARFDERVKGNSSYALQILDFLEKQESVDSELKNNLKKVKSSSLQRLATDPDFRRMAGIDIKDGKVITRYEPSEIVKPLCKVVNDLLRKDFTVKDIYYKDDRLNYLETFKKTDLPDKSKELAGNWELISTTPPKKADLKKNDEKKRKKSKSLISKRHTIIPKSTIIPISQPRVNKIYHELKDLDVKDFENSAAITFRVFIELSLDSYIEKFPILGVTKNSKLSHKLKSVATDFENKGVLDKYKLKGAYTASTMKDSMFSIDTLNAFVHNKDFNPDPESLKKNWDNLEVFFIKLWELI